jgi:hypothetical protein
MSTTDWRQKKRDDVRAQFSSMTVAESEHHVSPSGRYGLTTGTYVKDPASWTYSAGDVSHTDGSRIARVERNYSAFPFLWVEQHGNGHDYLICGEDYQGQTIIELDTGRRVDHLPNDAEHGSGFCWAQHYISADRKYLAVDGCYWACPYEFVIFDFSNPMSLPYSEAYRGLVHQVLDGGFRDDGSIRWTHVLDVRKSDGVNLEDLTADQWNALRHDDGALNYDLIANMTVTTTWHPDRPVLTEKQA